MKIEYYTGCISPGMYNVFCDLYDQLENCIGCVASATNFDNLCTSQQYCSLFSSSTCTECISEEYEI